MFVTFPKRKGFQARNVERRDNIGNRNHALKKADTKACSNGGDRNGAHKDTERSLPEERSNSNTSDISRTRSRRKRRRRRRRKKSPEEIQSPTDELKFQVRPKRGRRRRKRKRKVNLKENVMCMESSGSVSTPPLFTNSFGSPLQLSNEFRQVSPMDYENLPWANLEVSMDLTLVNLEVSGDGVDFDLLARENHSRWLANLEKARACIDNTSQ